MRPGSRPRSPRPGLLAAGSGPRLRSRYRARRPGRRGIRALSAPPFASRRLPRRPSTSRRLRPHVRRSHELSRREDPRKLHRPRPSRTSAGVSPPAAGRGPVRAPGPCARPQSRSPRCPRLSRPRASRRPTRRRSTPSSSSGRAGLSPPVSSRRLRAQERASRSARPASRSASAGSRCGRPVPRHPRLQASTRSRPAPATDPFARMAAARRYVDRVWS